MSGWECGRQREQRRVDDAIGLLVAVLMYVIAALILFGCTIHVTPDVQVVDPKINLTACVEEVDGVLNFVTCPDAGRKDAGAQ